MKQAFCILLVLVMFGSGFAVSNEFSSAINPKGFSVPTPEVASANFWQGCDITFWQTAPFAVFWTGFVDVQASSILGIAGATHWEIVLPVAIAISAGNAYFHSLKEINQSESSGQSR
ncbi:MAG: hypothetical protein WC890_04495 [Candidatus Margulisiibacteriota bacterium]